MTILEIMRFNLLSPVVLAFALGAIATFVRSDLKFPDELYTALSIYLLLALGLKGGAELATSPFAQVWRPSLFTIGLGVVTPLLAYLVLRKLGKFGVPDSAALAAHYGSVSVVTFIACLSFLEAAKVEVEPFLATLVVLLEVPAIIIALTIARLAMGSKGSLREVFHEILAGRSILLLIGGLAIGYLAGKKGYERVEPFFGAPFQGVVMLFLLEMGMLATKRIKDLKKVGVFLVAFAVLMPLVNGFLGVVAGKWAGLSMGGSTVLGVLAASASYIAAPAAVRIAIPEANPSYYLTASLAITFPFNLTVGIPVLYKLSGVLFA